MKIVYLYTALTTIGGADRIIIQKANYLADVYRHEVYIITDSQCEKPFSFPISTNVKHIDLGIDFGRQYKYNLILRYFFYQIMMKQYKTKLEHFLDIIKPHIVISTLGRETDFITTLNKKYFIVGEAHTTKDNTRKIKDLIQKGGLHKIAGLYLKKQIEKSVKQFNSLVVLNPTEKEKWKNVIDAQVIPNPLTIEVTSTSNLDSKNIIFVGRLEYEKGVDRLIDIWEQIYRDNTNWSLHIYGTGTMENKLRDLIRIKELKNISIHKPVPDIKSQYLDSSLLLLTSRYEGFGLVLIEAMSCGLPCIAFDCPYGPRNIIKNNINGFLIENGNIKEMIDKIKIFINDKSLRVTMGNEAAKSTQSYQPKYIMKQWNDLFNNLIHKQS